jgi:F0F1-type ATP synthase assembly protein I
MVKTNEAASTGTQGVSGVDSPVSESPVGQTVPGSDQRIAAASALALSWQLALVVIVPIVGGYLLDQHYHKAPIITFAGLVLALIGAFGVLSRLAWEAGRDGMNKPEGKA